MGIFDWLFKPKKEKTVIEQIEEIKKYQIKAQGDNFKINLFEKIPFDYVLGVLIKKRNESTIMPIKENILKFSKSNTIDNVPKDYKDIEKQLPYLVIIWGIETPDELKKKVFAQKTVENRRNVMMLIYVTMGVSRTQEVRETFSLIEKFDKKLWNDLSHITVPIKYPNKDFSNWK